MPQLDPDINTHQRSSRAKTARARPCGGVAEHRISLGAGPGPGSQSPQHLARRNTEESERNGEGGPEQEARPPRPLRGDRTCRPPGRAGQIVTGTSPLPVP